MNDSNHYNYLNIENVSPKDDSFLEVFERNVKSLYSQSNVISKIVLNYITNFLSLFRNAQAKEVEYLNPNYKQIFSFDFPKLSALFSLSLYIYMTGGLKHTDTSPVCYNFHHLIF